MVRGIDWARKVDTIKAIFGEGGPGTVVETIGMYVTRYYYFSGGTSYAAGLALLQIIILGIAVAFLTSRPTFRRLMGEE